MSLSNLIETLLNPSEHLLTSFSLISSLGLIVVMFSLGLKINLTEIKKILKKPRDLFVGLFFQIILLPILAIILFFVTDFSSNIKIAIMIIACMPSAATSNFIANKIDADTSLSITLTSLCTLLAIYTIPFFFKIFSLLTKTDAFVFNVSYTEVIIKIFAIVTVPVIIAILFKYYLPQIKKIEKKLDKISIILFILIIKFAIFLSIINIKNPAQSFAAVLIFMSGIIFSMFVVTKIMNISFKRTKTFFTEALLQNNILGFVIIFSISVKSTDLLPVLAIYGVTQYFVFVLLLFILNKNKSSIYISEKI